MARFPLESGLFIARKRPVSATFNKFVKACSVSCEEARLNARQQIWPAWGVDGTMNNSVENRFFAIVCGALLVFVAPLFVLFLFLSSERADKEIRDHISVLLVANAQALAKPLWDLDEDSVTQISATVVSQGAIVKVEVRDQSGQLDVSQSTIPRSFDGKLVQVSRAIIYNTSTVRRTSAASASIILSSACFPA